MDVRGWIPISLIASFNRVRQLTIDAQLVREVLTLSSLVQVRGNMVRMGGWERYVLPDASPSTVEEQPLPHMYQSMSVGGFYGDGGQQQQVQEQHQPPLGIAGSALWQGTYQDNGPDGPQMSGKEDGLGLPLNQNGGTANGRPLVDDYNDHPSGAKSAAAEELEEEEEEEEEEDVVFVMGHEAGTTWSPERRT
jgi:la-related protein 1